VAEIDRIPITESSLRIVPWDIIRNGFPIPPDGIFDAPSLQICINRIWANRLASAILRLAYRDAWLGTEQQQQDAVEQINIFLAELMLAEDCEPKTMNCTCIYPVNATINYYSSTDILNQTINNIWNNTQNIQNILELPHDEAVEAAGELLKGNGSSDHARCVASYFVLQYGREIGSIATEAWLDKYVDWELLDLVSHIIGIAGGILSFFSYGTAAGVAGILAEVFDEAVYQAALLVLGDLTDEEIEEAICELYTQMSEPDAAYFTFSGANFSNEIINDIWSDFATKEVYAGWLALASDPQLRDLTIQCCGECITWYPAWSQVTIGHRNPDLFSVRTEDVGTSTRQKKIVVRVNFSPSRRITAAKIVGIGKRYSNVLGLGYAAKVRTNVHAATDLVNYDGSPIENSQYNQLTTFYVPGSIVDSPQPNLEYIEFEFVYAIAINGTSSELAAFESAWGVVQEIKLCTTGGTWKSPS